MEINQEGLRVLIHFCWALGNPPTVIHSQLVKVHGDGVCTLRTVRNWVKKFEQGDFEITDCPRSGRPCRTDLTPHVQQLLDDYPWISSHALADELGEDKTTILRVLKNQLGLTRISRRWVPHEQTQELMRDRSQGASHLLQALSALGPVKQNCVVTGDQSWVYLRNEPTHMWGKRDTETPIGVKRGLGEYKLMLTVMFSRKGVLLVDFLPEGQKMNSSYITSIILPRLLSKIQETCPKRGADGWMLHLDNARPHNSRETTKKIFDSGFSRLPHPPYSPDLAPSDFALFGYLKGHLRSVECHTPDELRAAILKFLMSMPSNWFEKVWDEWVHRLKWVVENNGKYYTK